MIVRYFNPQSYKKSSYNHSIVRKILCDKNEKNNFVCTFCLKIGYETIFIFYYFIE